MKGQSDIVYQSMVLHVLNLYLLNYGKQEWIKVDLINDLTLLDQYASEFTLEHVKVVCEQYHWSLEGLLEDAIQLYPDRFPSWKSRVKDAIVGVQWHTHNSVTEIRIPKGGDYEVLLTDTSKTYRNDGRGPQTALRFRRAYSLEDVTRSLYLLASYRGEPVYFYIGSEKYLIDQKTLGGDPKLVDEVNQSA